MKERYLHELKCSQYMLMKIEHGKELSIHKHADCQGEHKPLGKSEQE